MDALHKYLFVFERGWVQNFPTRAKIMYGNGNEFGDVGSSLGKCSLFFLIALYPESKSHGDWV
jgi:hypothetical protein